MKYYSFFLSSFNLIIHKRSIKHPNGRNVPVDRRAQGILGARTHVEVVKRSTKLQTLVIVIY